MDIASYVLSKRYTDEKVSEEQIGLTVEKVINKPDSSVASKDELKTKYDDVILNNNTLTFKANGIDKKSIELSVSDGEIDTSTLVTKEDLAEELIKKSNIGHEHDSLYYRYYEMDEFLNEKYDNVVLDGDNLKFFANEVEKKAIQLPTSNSSSGTISWKDITDKPEVVLTVNQTTADENGNVTLQGNQILCSDNHGANKGTIHNYIDYLCGAVDKTYTHVTFSQEIELEMKPYQGLYLKGDCFIVLPYITDESNGMGKCNEIHLLLNLDDIYTVEFRNVIRWQGDLPKLNGNNIYEFIFISNSVGNWLGEVVVYK